MNISRNEQRALHVLALGGRIVHERGDGPKVTSVRCITREGMVLADFDLTIFSQLRRKRLIESRSGSPYRISKRGLGSVRAQLDNRGGVTC
ncbi:MAG: YjhX family toxin [Sphingobium sp.]